MAIPIQPSDTQAGCNPVSSNCVIWQGPDIPCITLCKGDSISDVTYKVATELCTLVDQLDIAGFDVSCFPPICPKPENIHDLIQFILDQLCAQQGEITTTKSKSTNFDCTDVFNCQITVATCFQYTNSYGDLVTQMSLQDYATAIANKVCDILDDITTINATLITLSDRIQVFEDCDACNPVIPPITIPTSCVSGGTNVPIETFVENLETAFCALQDATGTPTEIATAIAEECVNLDTTPTLNNSAVTYGTLPGWVNAGSYNTMSDAVTNMWIMLCDMRNAVQGMLDTCCAPSCDDVDITMSVGYTNPNIELTFGGSAPGFSDCYPAGMYVTITDAYGVMYTTQVSVIPNLGGATQNVDLSLSGLSLYTDYTVKLTICADDATLKCSNAIIETVENTALCPAMTYAADATYIDYSFTNPLSSPVTYIVECWNSGLTAIIGSETTVNPAAGAVVGSITGLTAATSYKLRLRTIVGSTIKDCPYTTVTTKP